MVTKPLSGKVRLSSMREAEADQRPGRSTETITYFAVTVKLRQTFGSLSSSR